MTPARHSPERGDRTVKLSVRRTDARHSTGKISKQKLANTVAVVAEPALVDITASVFGPLPKPADFAEVAAPISKVKEAEVSTPRKAALNFLAPIQALDPAETSDVAQTEVSSQDDELRGGTAAVENDLAVLDAEVAELDEMAKVTPVTSDQVADPSTRSFFGAALQAPVFIAPTPEPDDEKPAVVPPVIYREIVYADREESIAAVSTKKPSKTPQPEADGHAYDGTENETDELGAIDHGPEFEVIEPLAKDPMFTWRGKPIKGKAESTPAVPSALIDLRPEPATPKSAKKATPVSSDGAIDPRTWLGNMVQRALTSGASDVHVNLNGDKDSLLMRVRIDGQMQVFETLEGEIAQKVMGIFKAGAEFASAGSFVPEEAIYAVDVEGEERKARAVLFRAQDGGDALVMRLPPMGGIRRLDELEFSEQNLALFKKLLLSANRMLLIAGPMGSGKTTTSHAALMHVATPDRSVWTVEDPVERFLPGMTQLEVDDANGAGFEKLLPSLVRADYDTLFLGEIRDKATAAAGVRQAKAGRQVISTIHSNDNVTAVLRLIELAEDTPLSVMDAVKGVVSQRLVRRLARDWDGNPATKYKGRVPVHEVLMMNDDLVEAVMEQRPLSEIKQVAAQASASTFAEDGVRLIESGVTDEAEMSRVLGE